MIEVLHQNAPDDFLDKCGQWLEQSPAEHNLILSLCKIARERVERGEEPAIRFVSLFDEEGLIVASVQSPPQNLVLSRVRGEGIENLAEVLAATGARFPGIVGPSDAAAGFANAWTALTGQKAIEYMDQIIYSLKTVMMPPPVEGVLRLAKPEEAALIARWMAGFAREALPKAEQLAEEEALRRAAEFIRAGRVHVWEADGKPVSQAAVSGTEAVARINAVYTPPEERGKGYAGATVAHLSRALLEDGKEMCCLYADARNPVSNSIYRKIGYEFVGRSSLYVLEAS